MATHSWRIHIWNESWRRLTIVVASRGIRYSAVPAPAVTFRKGKCTRLLVRTRRESQVPKLSSREESFTAVRGRTRDGWAFLSRWRPVCAGIWHVCHAGGYRLAFFLQHHSMLASVSNYYSYTLKLSVEFPSLVHLEIMQTISLVGQGDGGPDILLLKSYPSVRSTHAAQTSKNWDDVF